MSATMTAGLELMLIGMGTVFFFLTCLVLATTAMSRMVIRFAPAKIQPVPNTGASTRPTEEELVAITAAIAEHRKGK